MKFKIEAAKRIQADADTWFKSLTKDQQKEYIDLHPNSKYAKDAGSQHPESESGTPAPPPTALPSGKPKPKSGLMQKHKDKIVKKLKKRYPLTTKFFEKLSDLFKEKKLKNASSPGWKKKYGDKADTKLSIRLLQG
jgi:hypothetical protein